MIAAEKANKTKLEFKYDGQGRITEKKVYVWVSSAWSLSKTEKFVYDGWNLIAVYDGSGAFLRSYHISGSLQGAGSVGGLLAENSNSTSYYPCYDGNGNVRAYIDNTGALVYDKNLDVFI